MPNQEYIFAIEKTVSQVVKATTDKRSWFLLLNGNPLPNDSRNSLRSYRIPYIASCSSNEKAEE